MFKKLLTEGVEKFVPKKCINYNNIDRDKWKYKLPDRIKQLINKKRRLRTRYQETKSKDIENKYKKTRNLVKNEIKKLIINHQREVALSCQTNPKRFWSYIKSKTGVNSSLGVIKYKNENNEI